MKYYVVTDTHGFYTQTRAALDEAGFFAETEPHKLVLCGDMMDRGGEAVQMQEFMLDLLRKDRLIYIRGNHEDLLEAMMYDIACGRSVSEIHFRNGTWGTAEQLGGMTREMALRYPEEMVRAVRKTPFYTELLPASVNYFETPQYVFVHGWIPCYQTPPTDIKGEGELHCRPDWREASAQEWKKARWFNGMECACVSRYGIPDKTIVCGHWHTSYGHAVLDGVGSEFEENAVFTPFYAQGIIALDACTAYSGFVNCIVLED